MTPREALNILIPPASPELIHGMTGVEPAGPVPEPPARPEWTLIKDVLEGRMIDQRTYPERDYKMVLAGHLRAGDVILWGDGEWRAGVSVIFDRDGTLIHLAALDSLQRQHLSPAALVVVRVES